MLHFAINALSLCNQNEVNQNEEISDRNTDLF